MLSRPVSMNQGLLQPSFGGRPMLDQKSIGANATAGNVTLGVADIFGGILNRTGPAGGFTDTWPDADTILAALDNPQKGDSWILIYRNGVAQAMTFGAGVGIVSGIGTLNCAASSTKWYLHTLLATKRTVILVVNTTNANAVLTGLDNSEIAQIEAGMGVTGAGIGASAVVLGVTPSDTPGGATITLSVNSTATAQNIAATFFPRIQLDALGVMTN